MNKDCASEIRCRVSFAALSVSSAVSVLPQLLWELTITTPPPSFFSVQMDLQDLEVWKLLPSPSIKHYLSSFRQRELQEIPIYLQFVLFDMDSHQGHWGLQRDRRSTIFHPIPGWRTQKPVLILFGSKAGMWCPCWTMIRKAKTTEGQLSQLWCILWIILWKTKPWLLYSCLSTPLPTHPVWGCGKGGLKKPNLF